MDDSLRRIAAPLILMLLPAAVAAEAPAPSRSHPELVARIAHIRTVALVDPEFRMFELTASNQPVFRPDWTDQSRAALIAALTETLREHGLALRPFDPAQPERKAELEEVRLLYGAVAAAVTQATFVNQFPAKRARFEYPLGDLTRLLGDEPIDAFLFVHGSGTVSSSGRRTVQALMAASIGVYSTGVDRISVGLVDRAGDLLWFGAHASTHSDLRYEQSVAQFASVLLGELPRVIR